MPHCPLLWCSIWLKKGSHLLPGCVLIRTGGSLFSRIYGRHLEHQLQTDSLDAGKDSFPVYFQGSASRPLGPPALWVGAPFPGRGRPRPKAGFKLQRSWVVPICTPPPGPPTGRMALYRSAGSVTSTTCPIVHCWLWLAPPPHPGADRKRRWRQPARRAACAVPSPTPGARPLTITSEPREISGSGGSGSAGLGANYIAFFP